jgi:hypothetical protein
MRAKLLTAAVAFFAAAATACAQTEKLTPANYARLRALVDVTPKERAWEQVAWRRTFFDGLVEAQAKDKPIFYWIYEGDVLQGC